ncbi:MAG: hypothetical protein LBQ66_03480, partial [Planctomycetaceae bacterium]|nr:hypothetical protein [Planctomycetaceae bacterium]
FYYTQRRAGRPRSSPLAASRQLSAVADVGRFGFTDAYWRSRCRRVHRRYSPRKPGGRLPTLRCLPCVCQTYVV